MARGKMIYGAAASGALWCLQLALGPAIGRFVAGHAGAAIVSHSDGKIHDPAVFITGRLGDALALLTAGVLLAGFCPGVSRGLKRIFPAWPGWVCDGVTSFAGVNLFFWFAARTILFWCLLFSGKGRTHNLTQFEIKRQLIAETRVPAQAVLLGSSQTRAEIDEKLLNEKLGQRLWTTELSFPGNRAFDLVLDLPVISARGVKVAICYVSESYFYYGVDSEGLPFFFRARDWAALRELRGTELFSGEGLYQGTMGSLLPLWGVRQPIASRVVASSLSNLKQESYNRSLETNLLSRALAVAGDYRHGPASEFQMRAFSKFAKGCRERGIRLVVCCGQLNPILGRAINPALRKEMLEFLREAASADPNILLLDERDLPPQAAEDYDDLTHVNEAAQTRFSSFLAEVLGRQTAW